MKTKLLISICFLFSLNIDAQNADLSALKNKCFTLYRFLEKNHYKPVEWNDSSSSKLFTKLIHELDEDKLFFTKADLKTLEPFRESLDEEVTGQQWSFLQSIIPLYKQRLQQFDSSVIQSLSKPFDYVKNESLVWPPLEFASTPQELQSRVQLYFKWQLMGSMADSVIANEGKIIAANKLPEGFAALESFFRQKLKKRMLANSKLSQHKNDIDNSLAESFFNTICWMYDPHSNFMNFAEKEEFQSIVTASEYTTGIAINKNDKGEIVISYLVPGGPAWRSGELHAGDIVISIKTENGPRTEVDELTEDQVVKLLEGRSSDKLSITVKNTAGTQKTVVLEKEKISSDENIVRSYLLNGNRRIGYIQLPGFYSRFEGDPNAKGCAGDVAKEVIKLKRDTIAGLILDLRNNGGGSLQEALELAGIFINEGPLCLIKDRTGKVYSLKDPNRGTVYDGPLLLLTNGASASASELTAAVLQDYNRALIVGGNTYGKGTAQVVLPLDTALELSRVPKISGDFVKVTSKKFYRVDGNTVQWQGVVPDISLPDVYQQQRFKESYQESALKPDTCRKAFYNALTPVPLSGLIAQSTARVSKSNYFTTITEFTEWSSRINEPRTIPLKWDAYTSYFKNRSANYKALENAPKGANVYYLPANNAVDTDRSNVMSPQSISLNESWLKKLKEDLVLDEAARIMEDWLHAKK